MSIPPNLSPQQVSAFPQHETITGVVERLTFYSAESGYTVARLTRPRSNELTTIVGSFANIQPGQTLQLTGFWRDHPQFGPQFQVINYQETKPATLTGLEAKTIHRLLEFDPRSRGFKRDSENPLPHTAIIADEASMLNLFLAYSLVKAVLAGALLLLVGDIDQLPSVGPGQILADLINSGRVPVVRLTQVFRQAQQSAIISAAHQINRGIYPTIEPISDNPMSDCIWHGGGHQPEHGVQAICELITDLLPRLGFNPAADVQVLCPMTRGVIGTRNLNTVLQQLINPPSPSKVEINRGGNLLREGDRIIQLTNDYNREVFNGDLGIILAIDTVEQEVAVQYGERTVVYDYADLNEIALAWCVTIHKSQGSEYPVVILPIYMQHYMMLTRNLFYTGLTRAKKLAIVVGAKKAIGSFSSQADLKFN